MKQRCQQLLEKRKKTRNKISKRFQKGYSSVDPSRLRAPQNYKRISFYYFKLTCVQLLKCWWETNTGAEGFYLLRNTWSQPEDQRRRELLRQIHNSALEGFQPHKQVAAFFISVIFVAALTNIIHFTILGNFYRSFWGFFLCVCYSIISILCNFSSSFWVFLLAVFICIPFPWVFGMAGQAQECSSGVPLSTLLHWSWCLSRSFCSQNCWLRKLLALEQVLV